MWWRLFRRTVSRLKENKKALEKVAKEAAEIWTEFGKAKADGNITMAEYVDIAKAAIEAGEAAYDLCLRMGWKKPEEGNAPS